MDFHKSMRTDSAMATDKKNNPSARKRALLAIVAIVIIALDIWWVASGQTHDVFFPQPAAETKPARKMYVELCGPSPETWSGASPCGQRSITFRRGPSSPNSGRSHAIKAPPGSPGIASPMSSHNGWLRRKIQLGA